MLNSNRSLLAQFFITAASHKSSNSSESQTDKAVNTADSEGVSEPDDAHGVESSSSETSREGFEACTASQGYKQIVNLGAGLDSTFFFHSAP